MKRYVSFALISMTIIAMLAGCSGTTSYRNEVSAGQIETTSVISVNPEPGAQIPNTNTSITGTTASVVYASTTMHLQVAKDHGFTEIANVDIMDAEGETALPVVGSGCARQSLC